MTSIFWSKKRVFWVYLGHFLDFGPEKKIWNMDLYHLGHFLLIRFSCRMSSLEDDLYVST